VALELFVPSKQGNPGFAFPAAPKTHIHYGGETMAGLYITCNGVKLPSPTGHSNSWELLWSANAGRGTDGTFIGDVIAQKQTHSVTWSWITEEDLDLILANLPSKDQGVADIVVSKEYGSTIKSAPLTAYRGSISAETAGVYGGQYYYKTVSTDIIEA
jgi:hypothetical protein